MNTLRYGLALLILGIYSGGPNVSGAEPAGDADLKTSTYCHVVSVGCAPSDGGTIAYVWHIDAVPEPGGVRVFKELAAPDIEECLSEIARTKAGLYESLRRLGPQSGQEATQKIMREASDAWSRFGVYQAVEEVATVGSRGPKVAALLRTCEDLRLKREGTAVAR